MKQSGLPCVITIAPMGENIMRDGFSIVDTCKELEQIGGDVVGMNCFRGPGTMMPYIKEVRKALKCHVAALPINYRTTTEHPTFFNLPDNNGCTWGAYDFKWIENLGTNLIREISITCGSTTIATYHGDYLEAMIQRDFSSDKKDLFNTMSGNIPELNDSKINEARRFIILIDILYEKKKKLVVRAEKKLDEIFTLKKNKDLPFLRTASRITEMTAKKWIKI